MLVLHYYITQRSQSQAKGGKFNIQQPKNIIIVTVNEESQQERMAVGSENIAIDLKKMRKNAEMRKK